MSSLSNKKIDKPTRVKIIFVILVLLGDFFILPWILKFPFFVIEDIATAPIKWFNYGIFKSIEDVILNSEFRMLFLVMQLSVFALILLVCWDVNKFKKKNRISEGVGGPEPVGEGQHGTSRWQNTKEMNNTATVWQTIEPLKKGGIIFGMEKSRNGKEKIWLDDEDVHNLIIGTTRSGKSRKIYLPSIWEIAKAGESMVIGDPKGELFIYTKEYLESEGYNVISLNLREPQKGNQWNMLHFAIQAMKENNIHKAVECAWDIASTIVNKENSNNTEPIWINGAQSVIASLIIATVMESEFEFQKHMTTVYYLLSELGMPMPDDTVPLNYYIETLPKRHPARDAFAGARIAAQKTRTSFFSSVLSELRLFTDPNLQNMTSRQDHDFKSIGKEKTAVFLIVPDEKTTRNVLATLYIDQLYQSLVEVANSYGGRLPRRVNFILDEFGNLPAIPNFEKKLTVAGGRGMRFSVAVQDVAQLKELYNKKSQTIMGNCHNWIYLLTSDMDTAKLISEKTGKYTVQTHSANSSIQSKGHSFGSGTSMSGRALLMPDEVLRWSQDEGLVIRVRQFPARYKLPDLSLYKANSDFGFVSYEDIDKSKKENQQIIKSRWENISARDFEETQIWIPDLFESNDDLEDKTTYNEQSEIDEEIEVKEDIAATVVDDEEIRNIIEQSQFISTEIEDDNEDDDFL